VKTVTFRYKPGAKKSHWRRLGQCVRQSEAIVWSVQLEEDNKDIESRVRRHGNRWAVWVRQVREVS
jgi:hypothetical protein